MPSKPHDPDDQAPPAEDQQAPAATGNMATTKTAEAQRLPDDSATTPLADLPIAPEPAPADTLRLDFTPVTMDVEPDYPGGSHRTLMIQGRAVKVAAGRGVTIPATAAEILGNAAADHRTEQIRQGGVPPILDLTAPSA